MITFPLTLRHTEEAAAPAAWLIPGADPQSWIDEISRWGVAMESLQLNLLPRSLHDPRPLGALVTSADAAGLSLPPGRVQRAQGFYLLAGKLYLPVDARLDPPVAEADLRSLLIWDIQILHPSAGLIGCRRDEALRISDLLLPPARHEMDWDRIARPTAYASRLLSVVADVPPTLEIILEQGRDDIGSENPESLPPSDDESKMKRMMDRARRPALRFIRWVASGLSGSGTGSGGLKNLRDWAARKLEAVDQSLLDARHKELLRLQKMLESNPDQALKFAISLRDVGSRGTTPPSAKLGERNPRFDMSRLSDGKPADSWSIPDAIRSNLLEQYRKAANRELNLRRYTRAAYVFAELLGDFSSAANALEQGHYFREAATLHRDRLKNPLGAAQCLKRGGLLLEAVAIFEELGDFEEAGNLYAAVDRHDDAQRCYRQAVKKALARDAHVEAARLLETKLHAPDEALALLWAQWPHARSSASCLEAFFNLLQRLHRDDETLKHVTTVRDQDLSNERVKPLVEILSNLAIKHPAPPVRSLAADATRVVAGRRLAAFSGAEASAIVSAVTRLCPDDRLLVRDGSRYLSAGPTPYKLAAGQDKPRLVVEFRLPGNVSWKSAVSTDDGFFAIGVERHLGTVILRGTWSGKSQKMTWPSELDAQVCALEPASSGRSLLLIPRAAQGRSSVFATFFPTDGFPEACRVGIPAWLPNETILGVGMDGGTLWMAHSADGGPQAVVSTFSGETGQLLATHGPMETKSAREELYANGRILVVARGGWVCLINGQTVLMPEPPAKPSQWRRWQLPQPCIHAVGSPPYKLVCVAAAFDEGGVLFGDEGTPHLFAQGMNEPKIGFMRGGELVAASGNEVRVYQTAGLKISRPTTFALDCKNIIALCPASKLHEMGFIGSDGHVRVFEFPPPRAGG